MDIQSLNLYHIKSKEERISVNKKEAKKLTFISKNLIFAYNEQENIKERLEEIRRENIILYEEISRILSDRCFIDFRQKEFT